MKADGSSAVVEAWFGAAFDQFHPLLQSLHRHGGVLTGPVDIAYGTGLAGWLGRLATRRLHLLPPPAQNQLHISVVVDECGLHWSRSFNAGPPLGSLFIPVGHYPTGHWKEDTGRVEATLGVDIRDGNWHWLQRSVRFRGMLLPTWLAPKVQASKGVVNGQYEFSVRFSLPVVGPVLSYRGALAANSVSPMSFDQRS